MFPVEYVVTLYNTVSKPPQIETMKGITIAENYTQAMSNIEDYYGDEIVDVKLYMLEESNVYEFGMMEESPLFSESN